MLLTQTSGHSVPLIVFRENALQQKRKRMIKGKKNNWSHIHFSSPESTAGGSSCVCQTPERDTIGAGGSGGGRGWVEEVSSVVLVSQEEIVNNGKI